MRFAEAFSPGWLRAGLSLIPAYILGCFAGPLVYNFRHSWSRSR